MVLANQRLTVSITNGPIDTSTVISTWVVDMTWQGDDLDGEVMRFEYAIDPPTLHQVRFAAVEMTWVSTREYGARIKFRAARRDGRDPGSTASEFHTFVIRAIDDAGAAFPVVARAFYARTVAPDATLLSPAANPFFRALFALPPRIRWSGDDPDGNGTRSPAGYRVLLLPFNIETSFMTSDPDSLIRRSMANAWEGWPYVGGDTTEFVIGADVFPPGASGWFAVLAVDEAGAATTYADMSKNILQFEIGSPEALAPRIHVHSPFIDFTDQAGGCSLDPLRWIPFEIPANTPTTIHWDAVALPPRVASRSRWQLDGVVKGSEGWSVWGPAASAVALPALSEGRHFLYIEAEDDQGGRSLAIIAFTVVSVSMSSELLIVDDTRREPDKFAGSTRSSCTTVWPSAAELDTFLFARGGFPWRGAINSAGAVSPQGLFAGYAFDTLGTRLGIDNPALAVSLSRLGQYQHVLWLVDGRSSQFTDGNDQVLFPVTALYAMSGPGRANTLSGYVAAGGKVWRAGEPPMRRSPTSIAAQTTGLVRRCSIMSATSPRSGECSTTTVISARSCP